ncbi:MAG TPA: glycosyltransferase family 39 protein [Ktedonobacterales bacterium]|jgi:4-amino-4-deoxy-L-arabinose transferase-like glycosyltransferase|nr:glycosyltransferase family 39 protein [Ktedonobacterales bacterium]
MQSNDQRGEARPAGQASAKTAQATWAWTRQWEFWVALALAIFLRFWRIDLTQFLDDQTGLFSLARTAATHGLIPLTGIPFSIRLLTPPWSIFSLLPFAAFTANPMPAVISIAVWNVLAVALCYIFALRYFGRRIAAVSTLLFATCGDAINYSRFIWQPNDVPTFAALWVLTLYLGCVDGRRRWFATNIIVLALGTMFHPTAALLAPVTLVGVALAPRIPPLRSWVIAAVGLVVVALPTLVWEALSGFSDLQLARAYVSGSHINPLILYRLYQILGGLVVGGRASSAFDTALNVLATLLFALGWLVVTARTLRPARSLPFQREAGLAKATRTWLTAAFRGLRADAAWRVNFLLWLSVTLPVALMLRHSGDLFAHYLMMLYPTAFIVSAIGAVAAIGWLVALVERRSAQLVTVSALALEAALVALIIARSVQWISYPLTLTNAQTFNAYHDYGYPLSVLQGGADTLARLQAETGAAQVEVITSAVPRYRQPEDFILAGERSDRLTLTPACLALPAETAGAWLVAPVIPNTPVAALLPHLGAAEQIGTLPMLGGPTYPVYQVSGIVPSLAGETQLTPTVFADQQGDSLRLLSATLPQSGAVLLRWQVVSASAPADQTRQFRVSVTANGATAYTDCDAQRWRPGETLFTWISLRADGTSDLSVQVETTTNGLTMPSAWGLRFLSDAPVGGTFTPAPATVGPADPLHAKVTANADGALTIPARTLSPAP